ncbi:MAG: hypothetical protein ACOC10_08180, partial [Bacteroidota bacterium]
MSWSFVTTGTDDPQLHPKVLVQELSNNEAEKLKEDEVIKRTKVILSFRTNNSLVCRERYCSNWSFT